MEDSELILHIFNHVLTQKHRTILFGYCISSYECVGVNKYLKQINTDLNLHDVNTLIKYGNIALLKAEKYPSTYDTINFTIDEIHLCYTLQGIAQHFAHSFYKYNHAFAWYYILMLKYKWNHIPLFTFPCDNTEELLYCHNRMYDSYCDIIKFAIDHYRETVRDFRRHLQEHLSDKEYSKITVSNDPHILAPDYTISDYIKCKSRTAKSLQEKVKTLLQEYVAVTNKQQIWKTSLMTYCKLTIMRENAWRRREHFLFACP